MGIKKFTKKEFKLQKKRMLARPEEVRIPIDDSTEYLNGYYLAVSRFFRLFEYIFIISALLFSIGFVAMHPEIMSYNNFLMFVKDIDMSHIEGEKYTELLYDTDYTDEIELYREGAVVTGSDNLFVFTATGRLAYTAMHSFAEPRLETSDSVALLYDFSSDTYNIYNSYTEIYKGKSEYPIYACTLSDSGRYAFVVKKTDGKYGVTVYSEENKHICSFESDKYIIASALDISGERLSVASLGVSEGVRYTEVKIYDCNSGTELMHERFNEAHPVSCGFFDDGAFFLITDKSVNFFGNDCSHLSSISHDSPQSFCVDLNSLLISYKNCVRVLSSGGSETFTAAFPTDVASCSLSDGALFVLSNGSVIRTDIESGENSSVVVGADVKKILSTSDKYVIACGVSKASLIEFN